VEDKLGNIEKLFRESFDGFESDVDPNVWNNISSQIGSNVSGQDPSSSSSASSPGGSSGFAGLGTVKIAAIIGTAGMLSVGGYFLFSSDDSTSVENRIAADVEIITDQKEEILPNDIKEIDENIELMAKSSTENNESSQDSKVPDDEQVEISSVPANPPLNNDKEAITSEQAGENTTVAKNNNKSNLLLEPPAATPETVMDEEENTSPVEEKESGEIFEASIYASISKGKQPLEVQFENRGSFSDNVLWKFRDGLESTSGTELHTFEKSGEYWVILEIRNENGQISKDSLKITVDGRAYIKAKINVFSPNGDNYNDEFKVEGDYIGSFSCKIFDRNNHLIFEWNWIDGYWDGRDLRGNIAPAGTYFYIIESADLDGLQLKPIKGTVTLFR